MAPDYTAVKYPRGGNVLQCRKQLLHPFLTLGLGVPHLSWQAVIIIMLQSDEGIS